MTSLGGTPIPLVDGVFRIADGLPVLFVSRCLSCRERFFPPRERCAACSSDDMHTRKRRWAASWTRGPSSARWADSEKDSSHTSSARKTSSAGHDWPAS